jgi:hypothetical protein
VKEGVQLIASSGEALGVEYSGRVTLEGFRRDREGRPEG